MKKNNILFLTISCAALVTTACTSPSSTLDKAEEAKQLTYPLNTLSESFEFKGENYDIVFNDKYAVNLNGDANNIFKITRQEMTKSEKANLSHNKIYSTEGKLLQQEFTPVESVEVKEKRIYAYGYPTKTDLHLTIQNVPCSMTNTSDWKAVLKVDGSITQGCVSNQIQSVDFKARLNNANQDVFKTEQNLILP